MPTTPHHPGESEQEITRRVELRLGRQAILRRPIDPPALRVAVREAVLRSPVGSSAVMTGQLDHLAEVSQFPNVSLRVVPVSAGYHPGSGDTIVCPEMEDLARGCDVLVHEAARGALLRRMGERWQRVADYHADTVELGALAARAGVRVLVLTHLIPGPATPAEEAAFADDVREGGFAGEVVVGRDLTTVWLAGGDAQPEVTPGIAPEVAVDLRAPRPSAAGARDPGDGGAPLASVK